jgi:TP901 family phage tail tape measure protein
MSYEIERLVVRLIGESSQFNYMMSGAEGTMAKLGVAAGTLGVRLMRSVSLPLAAIATGAVYAFNKFDTAMTKTLSIMGELSKEMEGRLTQAVINLSKTSTQPVTEIAESLYYLASAGYSAEQSMQLLPVVNSFATASFMDVAKAAELLTDTQRALGLSFDDPIENMKSMVKVSDAVTRASVISNATAEQLGTSLQNKAGAALRLFNKDLEEGLGILAAYANQGIKGQRAGEYLAIMLRDVGRAALKHSDTWKLLGLSVYDATGKMKSVADIIGQIEFLMRGATDEQKRLTLSYLGMTDRSIASTLALIGQSKAIRESEDKIRHLGITTDSVANKVQASFSGQLKIAKNNLMLLGIAIGETLVPWLTKLGNVIGKVTAFYEALDPQERMTLTRIGLIVAAIGPAIFALGSVATAIAAIGTALKFLVFTAPAGLIGMFAGLPAVLIAAGIAAGYLWYRFAGGEEAVASLGKTWSKSWGIIMEDIKSGKFEHALETFGATLEVIWQKIIANTVGQFRIALLHLRGDITETGYWIANAPWLGSSKEWAQFNKHMKEREDSLRKMMDNKVFGSLQSAERRLGILTGDIKVEEQKPIVGITGGRFGGELSGRPGVPGGLGNIGDELMRMEDERREREQAAVKSAVGTAVGGTGSMFGMIVDAMLRAQGHFDLQKQLDLLEADKAAKSPLFERQKTPGDTFTSEFNLRRFILEGPGGLARPSNMPLEVKSSSLERHLIELKAAVEQRGLPSDKKRLEDFLERRRLDPNFSKKHPDDFWQDED